MVLKVAEFVGIDMRCEKCGSQEVYGKIHFHIILNFYCDFCDSRVYGHAGDIELIAEFKRKIRRFMD